MEQGEIDNTVTKLEVLNKLNPEAYVDADGIEREVYTFKTKTGAPLRAVFYSPEEIPYSAQVTAGRETFILGRPPKHRSVTDWQSFISNLRVNNTAEVDPVNPLPMITDEAIKKGKALFFVESNPQNLLDLAFVLGVEDEQLREAREAITHGRVTAKAREVIDEVIAGKIFTDEKNYQGEALVVLSLLGDDQAKNVLTTELVKMARNDQKLSEGKKVATEAGQSYQETKPFSLDELVTVRLTDYLPEKEEGSLMTIWPVFDGSDWKTPRNTLHWTLNTTVASHMSGSWEKTKYIVIAPLKEMIEFNGLPSSLGSADTFWEVSPGEALKLPNQTCLVKPAEVERGKLFEFKGKNEVHYQTDINPQTCEVLIESLEVPQKKALEERIKSELGAVLGWEWSSFEDKFLKAHNLDNFLEFFCQQPYQEIVRLFYSQSKNSLSEKDVVKQIEQCGGILTGKIKEMAAKSWLKREGYEVYGCAMREWADPKANARLAKLRHKLGISYSYHTSGHPTSEMEKIFLNTTLSKGLLTDLEEGVIEPKEYRELANKDVRDYFWQLSPATRRMYYLMGTI